MLATPGNDSADVKNVHFKLILLALCVSLLMVLITHISRISAESAFVLILVYIQIEIFITLGKLMFKFDTDSTPKEECIGFVKLRYLVFRCHGLPEFNGEYLAARSFNYQCK